MMKIRLTTTDKTDYIFIDTNTPSSHIKEEQHKLNDMNPNPHMTLAVRGTLNTNNSMNYMKKRVVSLNQKERT